MTDTKMLETAVGIATKAHLGQVDKGGEPYILHCLRVMLSGDTIKEKICGVLHDSIEDTDVSLKNLEGFGFSKEIIDTVECLTKLPEEKYEDYLSRISTNPIAIKVKINDLRDNLDVKRLQKISDKDMSRINKYLKMYNQLTEIA
jgi:(p)ppGpp synthase/HD superfamily hydrolase